MVIDLRAIACRGPSENEHIWSIGHVERREKLVKGSKSFSLRKRVKEGENDDKEENEQEREEREEREDDAMDDESSRPADGEGKSATEVKEKEKVVEKVLTEKARKVASSLPYGDSCLHSLCGFIDVGDSSLFASSLPWIQSLKVSTENQT
jgi:hypothetical protein